MTGPTHQRINSSAGAGDLPTARMLRCFDFTGPEVTPVPYRLTCLEWVRRTLHGVPSRRNEKRSNNSQKQCSSAHNFRPPLEKIELGQRN